jgi:hypothetical protein
LASPHRVLLSDDRRRWRRWLGALSALAALALPSLGRADSVGLGVGIEPLHLPSGAGDLLIAGHNAAPVIFHLQIQLLPRLRLEPTAAYFHIGRDKAHTPAGGSSYSFNATAIGLGALYYIALPAPLGFYAGARLTVARYSGHFMDEPLRVDARSVTATDLFVGPLMGAEYALSRRLFIGAEMQLPFAVSGDRSARTIASADTPNIGRASVSADTIVFLRYFIL